MATAVVVLQRWGAAGSSSCSSEGTAPVRGGGGATMRAQARRPDAQALVPVPMRSNLRRGMPRLVPRLRELLRAHAAARIWAYMITDAAHMSINAPFANEPKPEALLNTKAVVAQYSITAAEARAASQGGSRACLACHDEARGAGSRGEHCDAGGADCAGCVACVGRLFSCPSCGRGFTMRWAYETGSGTASIGRDPSRFAVHEMPPTLCHTLHALERSRSAGSPLYAHNNCVLIAYTGADFCAGCALGGGCQQTAGGSRSKKCHSILNMHQDRGGGSNSQGVSANVTVNVGDPRTLSVELCDADNKWPLDGNVPASFTFMEGSVFELHPDDETHQPRLDAATGECVQGTYRHGMITPIEAGSVSAGYVYRQAIRAREVDVSTNFVVLPPNLAPQHATDHQVQVHQGEDQEDQAAAGGAGGAGGTTTTTTVGTTRTDKYGDTRRAWAEVAPRYAACIRPLLRQTWVGSGAPSVLSTARPELVARLWADARRWQTQNAAA